jgi:catechol 2,3-dioxygenase-like lactoylglutathione lyase family enzyme
MVSFYSQAFNVRFHEVDTSGLRCQFAEIDGITLKLVPLRDTVDFEGYPLHQLGFHVPDVAAILDLAERHGGRREGDIRRDGETIHTAVRDPDGNTIELYAGR